MKIILRADVENLGRLGDVVTVKAGYGRNYLLPRGLAIAYNRGTAKQIEGIQRARDARSIRDAEHAKQVREQLEQLEVTLPARAGDNGKLFGAVTPADVVAAVRTALDALRPAALAGEAAGAPAQNQGGPACCA